MADELDASTGFRIKSSVFQDNGQVEDSFFGRHKQRTFSLLGNDTPLRCLLMFDLFQVFVLVDLGFELSDFFVDGYYHRYT